MPESRWLVQYCLLEMGNCNGKVRISWVVVLEWVDYRPLRIALRREDFPEPVAIEVQKSCKQNSYEATPWLHTSADGNQYRRCALFLETMHDFLIMIERAKKKDLVLRTS